jgi:hypothetical protein
MSFKIVNYMESKVIFRAKRLDNGEFIEGFFTKKKEGALIIPVLERYKEHDNGDYIESIPIDGSTLTFGESSQAYPEEFVEWLGKNYIRLERCWVHKYLYQTRPEYQKTTSELFKFYKKLLTYEQD